MITRINKPIVIFRGDDTSAFNLRTIKIILKGDLDLSNAIAKFTLLDYRKEWTVQEVASGELTMSFTSADTKAMPLGEQTGTFRLYDMSTGEPRQLTVVNKIPFLITNRVCELDDESYHADVSVASGEIISIEFNVGVGAVNGKADKVKNAVDGDLAGLDEDGNLTDSEIPASDVLRKSQMDTTPTAGSLNPVTSGGIKQAIDDATPSDYEQVKTQVEANAQDIANIDDVIPSQATENNQLADKAFVNSSIATNTATFRGSYNAYSELGVSPPYPLTPQGKAAIATAIAAKLASLVPPVVPENNDYCFVQVPRNTQNPADFDPTVIERVDRYKCTVTESGGVTTRVWGYEWSLNNSSFTAEQWAAINSGITSALVTKLGALPTADELAAALLAKYQKPSTGIPKTDLAAGVQASLDKADTALQTAPVTSVNSKTGAVSLTGADLPVSSSDATKVDVALGNKLDNSGASEKFIDFGNGNKIGFSYFGTKLSISLYYLNTRMASFICDEGTAALENAFGNWAVLPTVNGVLALVSQFYAAVQQIAPAWSKPASGQAGTGTTYTKNISLCTYNGVLYQCAKTYTTDSSSKYPPNDIYDSQHTENHWVVKKVSELFLPLTGGTVTGDLRLGADLWLGENAFIWNSSDIFLAFSLQYGTIYFNPTVTRQHGGVVAAIQNIASNFSPSSQYAVNDLVVYSQYVGSGKLYRCTTAHQGAWDSNNFEEATVQDVLTAIWTALGDKATLASLPYAIASVPSGDALADRTVNTKTVNAATYAPSFPAETSGKSCDFYLAITSDTAGTVSAPSGKTLNNAKGESANLDYEANKTTVLRFTQIGANTYVVTGGANGGGSVDPATLNTKANSTALAPDWRAGNVDTAYAVNNYITYNGNAYVCMVAYTATSSSLTPDQDIYNDTVTPATGHWKLTDMTSPDATLDITSQSQLRVVAKDGTVLWSQGYDLASTSSATLACDAVNNFTFADGATTQAFALPTAPTGKVGDFILDIDNSANTDAATMTLTGLDTTFSVVVPKGESLTDMLAFEAGELAELYFTKTTFTVNNLPTWHIVKQVVENGGATA